MSMPIIKSYLKVDGKMVDQDDMNPEEVADIVERVMARAGKSICCDAKKVPKKAGKGRR